MIILESTLDGAGTIPEEKTMKSGETAVDGQALKYYSDGTLTKTASSTKPTFISIGESTAGGPVPVVRVREDQIFLADYASTSSNVPIEGIVHTLDTADATNIDADTVDNGIATIVSVDAVAKKCRIRFK